MRQYAIEQRRILGQRPGDKTTPDAPIAGGSEFTVEPSVIAIAATDEAETAGVADRSGKPTTRDPAHRRQEDRMGDAELFGEARSQCHDSVSIDALKARTALSSRPKFALKTGRQSRAARKRDEGSWRSVGDCRSSHGRRACVPASGTGSRYRWCSAASS